MADLGAFLRRSGRADAHPARYAARWTSRSAPVPRRWPGKAGAARGGKPRRTASPADALTSAERSANLAAGGLSTVAQHLFITQPTDETHLRHAFQKLGIASRADLPAQLAGEPPVPAGLPA
jgi:DNA-binding CsgD family transcriptional regulator